MDMGQKIYDLRNQKGMTLEELGTKVGVGKSTVRKWENGIIANMKRDKIAKVAEALETSPAYLMGWEEPLEQRPISKSDQEFLLKYHFIDEKGRHTVDTVLEMEYNRCQSAVDSKISKISSAQDKSYLLPDAAHQRTDIEVTDEMKKHDDDLMRNEDLWK